MRYAHVIGEDIREIMQLLESDKEKTPLFYPSTNIITGLLFGGQVNH